jgi:hypothetical protein
MTQKTLPLAWLGRARAPRASGSRTLARRTA